jgi:hypothetical protein
MGLMICCGDPMDPRRKNIFRSFAKLRKDPQIGNSFFVHDVVHGLVFDGSPQQR